MKKQPPLIDDDGEVRELTAADLAQFQQLKDADPELHGLLQKRRGRPPVETPKQHIGLRLDADVVEAMRDLGSGYNARVNAYLKKGLEQGLL